jgi:hypothetical protein
MKNREKLFFVLSIIFKPYIAFDIMEQLGYNTKQLCYYLNKWSDKGFYEYGVSCYSGWIVFSNLTGEYNKIFTTIKYFCYDRPLRNDELDKAVEQIKTDIIEAEFNNKIVTPFKAFIIEKYMEGFKND